MQHTTSFVDGGWRDSGGDHHFPTINPTTEEVQGSVKSSSIGDADDAVAAAKASFLGWASQPAAIRADALARIAAALRARSEVIAGSITWEHAAWNAPMTPGQ